MNALANDEVGEYLDTHCISSFLKVGTFTVAGNQKQGGNVASYFCLGDGSVLHAVAGPVDAQTLLREARWVIDTRKLAAFESRGDAAKYRAFFRKAHHERLMMEYGIDKRTQINANETLVSQQLLYSHQQTVRNLLMRGHGWNKSPDNQAKVHMLLIDFPMAKVQDVYRPVFENILNERVSTLPVALT